MRSTEQLEKIRHKYQSNEEITRLFQVLGDRNRWRIFSLLLDYNDLCVTELARILEVSVPAVSQHLRLLELSGLIAKEREGQKMCYTVNTTNPQVKEVARLAHTLS